MLIDLEELESCFIDSAAGAVAGGKVVDDRSLVRGGPGGPFHCYGAAGGDGGCCFGVGCGFVTDDVGSGVCGRGDEAEICCIFGPADGVGRSGLVWILGYEISGETGIC